MHLKQNSLTARLLKGALASLVCLTAALSAPAWAGWNGTAETIQNHPTWLYTPAGTMAGGKRALLIVMHGCDQTHTQLKEWGNLASAAERRGAVIALPWVAKPWPVFSSTNCWNYDGATDGSGNIADMEALTKTLVGRGELNIDPRHVYITGLSSGASLAMDLACKAPDLIAGVSAIAGPSVGSSQMEAIKDGGQISFTAEAARDKCKALAGKSKLPYFDLQIAHIGYGEKDKNAESPGCAYSAGATNCPGTFQLVSKKWSIINAEMFRQIYASSALSAPGLAAGGTAKESVSTRNGKTVLALDSILGVGHAWPAGSGQSNDINKGGVWMAQQGMNYADYVLDWFIKNNLRGGGGNSAPIVKTCNASVAGSGVTISGEGSDDGSIVSYTVSATGLDAFTVTAAGGWTYSVSRSSLHDGAYKATVTATDNEGKVSLPCETTFQIGTAPLPLLAPPAVSVQSVTSSAITLAWANVKDARSYSITRTGGSTGTVLAYVPPSSGAVTYTASGLSPSTTYTFTVQTVNAEDKPGKASDALPVTTKSGEASVCNEYTSSNKAHVDAKRAYDYFYQAFAKGSNLYLGWNNAYVVTTIAEIKPGYFVYGKCPK